MFYFSDRQKEKGRKVLQVRRFVNAGLKNGHEEWTASTAHNTQQLFAGEVIFFRQMHYTRLIIFKEVQI